MEPTMRDPRKESPMDILDVMKLALDRATSHLRTLNTVAEPDDDEVAITVYEELCCDEREDDRAS
jgi:hypothetical protein